MLFLVIYGFSQINVCKIWMFSFLYLSFWFSCLLIFVVDAECLHPQVRSHSRCDFPLNTSSVSVLTIVTYECDDGFKMFGHKRITCKSDGSWSDEAPICGKLISYFSNYVHCLCSTALPNRKNPWALSNWVAVFKVFFWVQSKTNVTK